MMFLSGIFFPITTLPGWLQTAVHVLPLTWLTDAMHRVMNDGAGLPRSRSTAWCWPGGRW